MRKARMLAALTFAAREADDSGSVAVALVLIAVVAGLTAFDVWRRRRR